MKFGNYILLISLFLFFQACCPAKKQEASQPFAQHVILVGFDGWGAYSVPKADMPNLKALMADGSYTLKKRSVLPSSSAVNWASMFMGAGPELHGYTTWGARKPELPSRVLTHYGIFPSVFGLLRDTRPESKIGYIYEWDGMKYLAEMQVMDFEMEIKNYKQNPDTTAIVACNYIREEKPNLLAVIIAEPDETGHGPGHDAPEYYEILKKLDKYLGQIIQAVKDAGIYDETIFIVTSDHGGIGKGHGGKTMTEMETPFIIAGKNVKKGFEFDESMMQFDVAATIASIFALQSPQVWIGRPMKQVFTK
ncbi:MAG: alkaline phosphatase [Prolixibacteraceae bacterium]|nr:alkaline phosphatase [Prolixibacteraceae bacterium]